MSEPDELYVLAETAPLRLAAASAPPACIVYVGGEGNPGARVCGHSEAEHWSPNGYPECRACKLAGLPKRLGPGFTMWSGWDHAYIDHMPERTAR